MNVRFGGGNAAWGAARRMFHQDPSVTRHKVAKGTWRRILRFAKPYRGILSIFLVLIAIDSAIGVANPLIYRAIIDQGILRKDTRLIIVLALVVGGLAVADAAVSIGERWVSAVVGEGMIFDLRSQVFDHVQAMPLAFFTRTQTGALVSRLNNDVLGAQSAFTDILSSVVSNVLTVSMVLATMVILSWQITLTALAILPIFVLPARRVGRRIQAITREAYNLNAEMLTMMTERFNVAGALLVKLFGNPRSELDQFRHRAGRVRDIGVTQALYSRLFFVALILTASIATAVIYGWGGVLSAHGALQVGTVVALTAYLNRLYGPLTALSNVQVDVMTTLVSFDRVFEVLDLKPMIADRPGALPLERGPTRVTFDHVSFRYPGARQVSLASLESVAVTESLVAREVLFDLSFEVLPGQMAALVGPTGAGKTTIAALVARLYDPTTGSVRFNGRDLRDATLASIRAKVGMVTQDSHLFHDTIRNNLLYVKPNASESELREALRAAQILEFVESLPDGLDTVVGDRGYRLSGGEKQRLAIARILLKAPDVVVLDEATAHLDSESEAAVQAALEAALQGRTSIVIAHRLSTVRNADKILVVQEGRIVEEGRHDELIERGGLYAELYRVQFAGPTLPSPGNGEVLSRQAEERLS
jgi:ATP-binding cassette subfamily B protein